MVITSEARRESKRCDAMTETRKPAVQPLRSAITYEDFDRVDIRVGTITAVDPYPEARRPAFKLQVDFGPEIGTRKTSAQITKHYHPQTLVGRQVAAVVNFPPKQIGKFLSE